MRRFALALCWSAGAVSASAAAADQVWTPMTGPEVRAALTGQTLRYNLETIQDFRASGRTLYTHKGRESWGYWALRGDQYCSQWPPNALWDCYDMAKSDMTIRFIGKSGDVTDGTYVD